MPVHYIPSLQHKELHPPATGNQLNSSALHYSLGIFADLSIYPQSLKPSLRAPTRMNSPHTLALSSLCLFPIATDDRTQLLPPRITQIALCSLTSSQQSTASARFPTFSGSNRGVSTRKALNLSERCLQSAGISIMRGRDWIREK